jgi:hypothetical protein
MNYMFAKCCGPIGMVVLLGNAALGAGPQALDATQVRLLPGSPFYERQESHRTGYLVPKTILRCYPCFSDRSFWLVSWAARICPKILPIFRLLAPSERRRQVSSGI